MCDRSSQMFACTWYARPDLIYKRDADCDVDQSDQVEEIAFQSRNSTCDRGKYLTSEL